MSTRPVVLISIRHSPRGARFDAFETYEEALSALKEESYDLVRIGNSPLMPVTQFLGTGSVPAASPAG
ncbi:translation initiation factor IF-3 [Phyllobacterium ifriqiyense]|uniref:Translation initiation factor IF-3 n=1 Tax=Phyllobacterium ifriqiyense TaxID=314238 RepID=A0ABU0S3S4_9HYPH|nr:translation initiation factor IF-3 [Phyllobacterium ifriqiyense]